MCAQRRPSECWSWCTINAHALQVTDCLYTAFGDACVRTASQIQSAYRSNQIQQAIIGVKEHNRNCTCVRVQQERQEQHLATATTQHAPSHPCSCSDRRDFRLRELPPASGDDTCPSSPESVSLLLLPLLSLLPTVTRAAATAAAPAHVAVRGVSRPVCACMFSMT